MPLPQAIELPLQGLHPQLLFPGERLLLLCERLLLLQLITQLRHACVRIHLLAQRHVHEQVAQLDVRA